MSRSLPARANLEHLRNEAKQRLKQLRTQDATAKLTDAQRRVAREYGFASWRQLKAAVDQSVRERVFRAAGAGDVDAVRRALDGGFPPGTTDGTGRTLQQIAKTLWHAQLELLVREYQECDERPDNVKQIVKAIHGAAADGRVEDLRRLLEAHPELLDARSVDFHGQTALHKAARANHRDCVRLLLERGADVDVRDYGDNAYALHFAADAADLEVVMMLVDAGSGPADVIWPGAALLDAALESATVARDEIDAVVLTHLDFDHSGGTLSGTWPDELAPAFPRVILSEVGFGVPRPNEREGWDVGTRMIAAYERAGRLERAADGAEFRPGLRLIGATGRCRERPGGR